MEGLSWIFWVSLNAVTVSLLERGRGRSDTEEGNVTRRQRWDGMKLQAKDCQ